MDKNEIIERIINLRVKNNLNKSQLSNKIGLEKTTISRIERGVRDISINELVSIASFFEVSTDYLLGIKSVNQKTFDISMAIDNGTIITNKGIPITNNQLKLIEFLLKEVR